MNMNTRFEKF